MQLSDEALVAEVLSGSKLAFGLLMKRYERLVYAIALNKAGNPDCAMDITQNVFLKAHTKLDAFTGAGEFKAWLCRIAINESHSWFRRHKKDRLTDELTEANAPVLQAAQSNEVEQLERRSVIHSELRKLNENQRLAVSTALLRRIHRARNCNGNGHQRRLGEEPAFSQPGKTKKYHDFSTETSLCTVVKTLKKLSGDTSSAR